MKVDRKNVKVRKFQEKLIDLSQKIWDIPIQCVSEHSFMQVFSKKDEIAMIKTGRISVPSHVQGLEMITFIIYNPWPQTSFLLISDYLENPVLEVLSKFSTSKNTANIYGSGAVSY